MLSLLTSLDGRDNVAISVAGRPHTLACSLKKAVKLRQVVAKQDSGCAGRVVLLSGNTPQQRSDVRFKLALRPRHNQGTLTLTFNPSRILAGADVQPTLIAASSGKALGYPSSSSTVTRKLFELGFDLLESLPRRNVDAALFDPGIDAESIRVHRIQWDAFIPSSDPDRFLQLLPFLCGQTIHDDGGVVQLATHLGLTLKFVNDPQSSAVTSVTLEKRQGRKKLFSMRFAIDAVSGSDSDAKRTRGSSGDRDVRLSVIAYADGIATIVRAARRRSMKLVANDRERFKSVERCFEDGKPKGSSGINRFEVRGLKGRLCSSIRRGNPRAEC